MDVEKLLRRGFEDRLGALDTSSGDASGARRTGTAMRVRRRAMTGAIALVVVAAGLVASHHASARPQPAAPLHFRGSWQELPAPPISPRAGSIAVWTGHEVLFLGGQTRPCPPYITCDAAVDNAAQEAKMYGGKRDGVAFDPATGAWRRLAAGPIDLQGGAAYAGGHVFVGLHDYDVATDTWSRFTPRWAQQNGISAWGGRVWGKSGYFGSGPGHVLSYDPRSATWHRYPADRLRPRLVGTHAVAAPGGPYLVGRFARRRNYHGLGWTAVVDRWTGRTWRRLAVTGSLYGEFVWTGHRLVDTTQGSRGHGTQNPWPHPYPYGGRLDPGTGAWSPLPASWEDNAYRCCDPTIGWDVGVDYPIAPQRRFDAHGQVYDDDTGQAWLLPRPDGAPQYLAATVWAGDRLYAFGGADFNGQRQTGLSGRAWVYTP